MPIDALSVLCAYIADARSVGDSWVLVIPLPSTLVGCIMLSTLSSVRSCVVKLVNAMFWKQVTVTQVINGAWGGAWNDRHSESKVKVTPAEDKCGDHVTLPRAKLSFVGYNTCNNPCTDVATLKCLASSTSTVHRTTFAGSLRTEPRKTHTIAPDP